MSRAYAISNKRINLMHLDLAPLANGLINIAVSVAAILLPPLIGAAGAWFYKRIGLTDVQTQAIVSAEANKALMLSLDFAKGEGEIAVDKYLDAVVPPNNTLSRAAAYAIAHWPDTFKKLGVDVTTPEGQKTIVRAITTRIQATLPCKA